ncbi:hypothetical protein [Abyssogena phaseoliformis symbiont]|uniref:hypothetical protein n=1 Tax=Abyssogena phaseoliformis symbiont TaxID=596095 RepID=UPI001914DBF4|nr:hypothetical protein [Abyssogena phaseoliformis symbiont]
MLQKHSFTFDIFAKADKHFLQLIDKHHQPLEPRIYLASYDHSNAQVLFLSLALQHH